MRLEEIGAATPLSASWFRARLSHFRDRAIDTPTPENVSAFLYLQRVMLDKSTAFADAVQRAVIADPLLDTNAERPIATTGGRQMDVVAGRNADRAVEELGRRAGLMAFLARDCAGCTEQAGVLRSLATRFGIQVLPVATDGAALDEFGLGAARADRGQARALGVIKLPALFAVGEDRQVVPIAQGLASAEMIKERLLVQARQAGWLDEASFQATRPTDRQLAAVRPETIDPAVLDDPVRLVRYLRALIGGE